MRTHFLPIWLNSKKDYLPVSFIKIQFYFYLYKNTEIVTLSVFILKYFKFMFKIFPLKQYVTICTFIKYVGLHVRIEAIKSYVIKG